MRVLILALFLTLILIQILALDLTLIPGLNLEIKNKISITYIIKCV